jgi:hypothetical protein
MAKLNESMFVVKVSELLKDNEHPGEILDQATLAQLEAVVQELAGPGKLVEIITDNTQI